MPIPRFYGSSSSHSNIDHDSQLSSSANDSQLLGQILRAVQQQQADFRDFKEDTLNKIDDMAEQVRSLQEEKSTPKSSRKIKLPTNASVS